MGQIVLFATIPLMVRTAPRKTHLDSGAPGGSTHAVIKQAIGRYE